MGGLTSKKERQLLRRCFAPSFMQNLRATYLGSQHPSPNVKTFCKFEPQIWLDIITSRDAKSACFKGSRTSCREIIFGIFWPKFWPEKITSRDGCFLPIIGDFNGFPHVFTNFQSISIDFTLFPSVTVTCSHFQTFAIAFNHFESV